MQQQKLVQWHLAAVIACIDDISFVNLRVVYGAFSKREVVRARHVMEQWYHCCDDFLITRLIYRLVREFRRMHRACLLNDSHPKWCSFPGIHGDADADGSGGALSANTTNRVSWSRFQRSFMPDTLQSLVSAFVSARCA